MHREMHRTPLSDCFVRHSPCRVKALGWSRTECATQGARASEPSPNCTARQETAPNLHRAIDELDRWMYKQVVNGVAAPDNRRALAHRVLPSRDGAATLETRAARAFAFQGRCLWERVTLGVAHRNCCRCESGEGSDASRKQMEKVGSIPTALPQAPFCRQGAATPANGPAWAAPRITGTPHTRSRKAEPAYPSGTGQAAASMVRQAPPRLNDGLQGLWAVLAVVCTGRERVESRCLSPLGNLS
jgi:hypothetical protein